MEALLGLIGLGLAAPGVVDVVINAGLEIERKIQTYRNADATLQRYRDFGVGMARGEFRSQLVLIQMAKDEERVDRDLIDQLDKCFRQIVKDVIEADKEVQRVYPKGVFGKLRYVFVDNIKLGSRLESLEKQRQMFVNSAFYVNALGGAPSPAKLSSKQATLLHESPMHTPGTILPFSDILVARAEVKVNGMTEPKLEDVVLEKRKVTQQTVANVEILSQKLRTTPFSEGILHCLGFRQNPHIPDQYELIFLLPENKSRQSLLNMLITIPEPSLTLRVKLCQQLSKAISHVHAIGHVHKSIWPGAVLLIGDAPGQVLFLTGWTLARRMKDPSARISTIQLPKAIYLHPDRQQEQTKHRYTIAHDIYSLGVCMLEILFWEPMVREGMNGSQTIWIEVCNAALRLGHSRGISADQLSSSEKLMEQPTIVRDALLELARDKLPSRVGDTLSRLVVNALQGFPGDLGRTIPESSENEEQKVNLEEGMEFIQKVLMAMDGISI